MIPQQEVATEQDSQLRGHVTEWLYCGRGRLPGTQRKTLSPLEMPAIDLVIPPQRVATFATSFPRDRIILQQTELRSEDLAHNSFTFKTATEKSE